MSNVQQIKATIRQNQLAALLTQRVGDGRKTILVNNFFAHGAARTNCNIRDSISKSAGSFPISSASTLKHIPGREFTVTFAPRRKIIPSVERAGAALRR